MILLQQECLEQPERGLPVTTHPTMLSNAVRTVVGRVVVKQFDVAYRSGSCESSFHQIVT